MRVVRRLLLLVLHARTVLVRVPVLALALTIVFELYVQSNALDYLTRPRMYGPVSRS